MIDPVLPMYSFRIILISSNLLGPSRSLQEAHPFPSYHGKEHEELPSQGQCRGISTVQGGLELAVPWLKELTGPHNKSMQRDLQTWVMADLILSILYLVF